MATLLQLRPLHQIVLHYGSTHKLIHFIALSSIYRWWLPENIFPGNIFSGNHHHDTADLYILLPFYTIRGSYIIPWVKKFERCLILGLSVILGFLISVFNKQGNLLKCERKVTLKVLFYLNGMFCRFQLLILPLQKTFPFALPWRHTNFWKPSGSTQDQCVYIFLRKSLRVSTSVRWTYFFWNLR